MVVNAFSRLVTAVTKLPRYPGTCCHFFCHLETTRNWVKDVSWFQDTLRHVYICRSALASCFHHVMAAWRRSSLRSYFPSNVDVIRFMP